MGAAEVFVEAGGTVGSTGLGSGRGARGERWAARGLRPTAGCSLDLHSFPPQPFMGRAGGRAVAEQRGKRRTPCVCSTFDSISNMPTESSFSL